MTGKIQRATPYAILPGQAPNNPDGTRDYKRRRGLAKVDGRTKEAALLRDARAGLLEHLGRPPNAIEAALIERIAWLELKCAIIERKIAEGADSDYDGKAYQGWANTLTRAYATLAKAPPAPTPAKPTLGDMLRTDSGPVPGWSRCP